MSRTAPKVHADAIVIARMEAFAQRLPQGGHVTLVLDDGSTVQGLVSAVPSIQVLLDADGNEGLNASVRIEVAPGGGADRIVWLDRIRDVVRMPNPSPPQPGNREHPVDPNAPTSEAGG